MKRLDCLEGVRGLASILVLFNHLGVMFYPAYYWGAERTHLSNFDYYFGQTPLAFILNGNSGIFLLLIITGFGGYQICNREMDYIRKFVILRYFKLLILSILSTLIVLFCAAFGFIFFKDIIEKLNTPWFGEYDPWNTSYISLLMSDPLSSLKNYNPVLWTMKMFFLASLIAVLFSVIIKDSKKKWLLYAIAVIILINMNLPYYIACIAGVLLADYYDAFADKKINTAQGIILFAIGIYLCGYPTGIKTGFWFYQFLPFEYTSYYHLIGGVSILFSVLFTEQISKIFCLGIFQFLGKYSMSVYAVHYCILISFSAYLFMKLDDITTYNVNCLVTCLCTIIMVFALAYFFEKIIKLLYRYLNCVYDRLFV